MRWVAKFCLFATLGFATLNGSCEMTFIERLMLVTGDRPYEWANDHGIEKALMTSLTRVKGRPHRKSLDKLVAASGIQAEWWLNGNGRPPSPAEAASAAEPRSVFAYGLGSKERRRETLIATESAFGADAREVDTSLWDNCFRACQQVHGAEFGALPPGQQSAYANDLYNLVVRMASQTGRSVQDAHRLEVVGLADLLRVFGKMGWARRFPDRRRDLPGVAF